MNKDKHRVQACISDVFVGKEDHGIWTVSITLDDMGYTQSFGNLCLDKENKVPAFVGAIENLFNVSDIKNIIGKKCYALYSFGKWNEPIEGIEYKGKRFTLTGFRKSLGEDAESPLTYRIISIEREITQAKQRILDREAELEVISKDYKDWG
jgi:hypothetical protein